MDLNQDLVETAKALEWWRDLSQNDKGKKYFLWQKVATHPFKEWTFEMAASSSRCIQDIYEKTHDLK